MKLPFLSEVIAESLWRAMGWVFDEMPNSVINTLKQVLSSIRDQTWTEMSEELSEFMYGTAKH